MRHLSLSVILCVILALAVSATGWELPRQSPAHKINKREDAPNKHQRDPGKVPGANLGRLRPIPDIPGNSTKLTDVRLLHDELFSRLVRNDHNKSNLYLRPPPSQFFHRNHIPRSQRPLGRGESRYRGRYQRSRAQRSKAAEGLAGTLSRWFFSDDSDEEESKVRPRKIVSRHYRPPSIYHNYPPYWASGSAKSQSARFPHKPRAINHHQRPAINNKINFVKHECNACNSVPWTPILKPSLAHGTSSFDDHHSSSSSFGSQQSFNGDSGSYGVPTIDVHHDTSGYSSDHRSVIAPPAPAPVNEHSPDSTIPESYGLPLGNIPTGHGLLPPINHNVVPSSTGLVPPPQSVLDPVPTDGLLHSIPFPELSPIPVVPLHDPGRFVETPDLVPPVPPQNSANVIFTISENNGNRVVDNHLTSQGLFGDQHSDSSSLVNSHILSHIRGGGSGVFSHFDQAPGNNHVNLDIVKSVPVAEYTSSIQYPLQVIQSPSYIDITSPPNATKLDPVPYEKQPQTGSQKISDILFGLVKDAKPDALSGSATSNVQHQTQTQTSHYLPTILPPTGPKNSFVESGRLSHGGGSNVYGDNLVASTLYNTQQNPSAWPSPDQVQYTGPSNVPPFVHPQQSKPESAAPESFPDPTSTTWLLPAQSNVAPQWILPVSNQPSVPYPPLPPLISEEDGIASVVNEELSPSPSPQPMNESKPKKIQIIIPYTTGDNKDYDDSNALEAAHSEVYKTTVRSNASLPGRLLQGTSSSTAEFSVPANSSQNGKLLNDVHHILALNIKQLLKDEVEKPKSEQNIRLQKNIDDWTALEYSNHKTVARKEPLDVISYANSVTSIPGTSINHILLTSKKIPDKYLTTTPLPSFDDPDTTTRFTASSPNVGSKPFTTKSYDTSGLYSTVTRITPVVTTATTTTTTYRPTTMKKNHKNGYSEVVKTKANQWAKLNENLVVPENVANKTLEGTTAGWSDKVKDEKVYVVTPVSVWDSAVVGGNRRTTRQAVTTETPQVTTTTSTWTTTKTGTSAAKSHISKPFGNKTERVKISKFNKPKPIQKFFATTTKPTQRNITKVEIKQVVGPITVNHDDDDAVMEPLKDTQKKSINDVFPFRNGGELPLELAIAKNTAVGGKQDATFGVRKTLVTQVSTKSATASEDASAEPPSSTHTTEKVMIVVATKEVTKNVSETETGQNIQRGDIPIDSTETDVDKSTRKWTSSLPPGIFGETKKVQVRSEGEESESIATNETIRLLKKYLNDTSDEHPEEKTEDGDRRGLSVTDRP